MNNFKKIYLNILYENKGTHNFDIEKWKHFLKTATFFDLEGNIISEDKNLTIDVPENLMNFCYSYQNEEIPFENVKKFIEESKHARSIKHDYKNQLYFSIFDFNDDLDIRSFHYKFFNNIDEEELSNAVKEFKENVIVCGGFFNTLENVDICVVNSDNLNIQRIMYHELGHYIQNVCNVRILKNDVTGKYENSKLKDIGITLNDFNYYMNRTEFFTHVDELIIGLKNVYQKYYNNLTKFTFFYDIVLKTIMKEDSDKILQSDFVQKYILANNNEYAALAMFIASFYLNVKFQKIRDLVYNSFKK